MSEVDSTSETSLGAFWKGLGSGLFSGALMSTIVAILTPLAPLLTTGALPAALGMAIWHSFIATAPLMILATSLFSGVMAAYRHASHAVPSTRDTAYIPLGTSAGPAIVMAQSPDLAPERNWSETVERNGDTASRIQQIINDRSTSDKNRGAAILAAREAEAAAPAQQNHV